MPNTYRSPEQHGASLPKHAGQKADEPGCRTALRRRVRRFESCRGHTSGPLWRAGTGPVTSGDAVRGLFRYVRYVRPPLMISGPMCRIRTEVVVAGVGNSL